MLLILALLSNLYADFTPLTDNQLRGSHLENTVVFKTIENLNEDSKVVLNNFEDSINVNDSETQFTLNLTEFVNQFEDPQNALNATLLAFQDTLATVGIYYDLNIINPQITGNLQIQILTPDRKVLSQIFGIDYIERLEFNNITLGSKNSPTIGNIIISEIQLGPNSQIRIINRP